MNFLTTLKQQRPVVFSALVALFSLVIMICGGIVAGVLSNVVALDYYAMLLLQELFSVVFLLPVAYASKTLHTFTRRGTGLMHGLLVSAYPVVLICFVGASMLAVGAQSGKPLQPTAQIIIYFASMLSIGVVEELVFRGIIAEALICHYGTDYRATWKATIIGGIIFGLAHMSNIFGAAPLGVFIQVTVAIVLGMLFSAIYYRTGNLWICILLHAGLDAASMLESGLYGTGTISDMVSSFSLMNLTPCITYGLPILFLLRRSKNVEVQFWFGRDKQDFAA